jgi:hypothetical protein
MQNRLRRSCGDPGTAKLLASRTRCRMVRSIGIVIDSRVRSQYSRMPIALARRPELRSAFPHGETVLLPAKNDEGSTQFYPIGGKS